MASKILLPVGMVASKYAAPVASDVHIDKALSDLSLAYMNSKYIADMIFPIVPVDKQSDKFYKWTKDFWFRNSVRVRAPGGEFPEVGLGLTNDNYSTIVYNLAARLPDENIANADEAVNEEFAKTKFLADQFQLNREVQFVADFFKTTVWGTDSTLSGTAQWSDYANSDPIDDVKVAKQTVLKNTGQEPNLIVVGREVYDKLRDHPLILDKYRYTGVPSNLSFAQVAAALDIEKLIVGNAIDNSAQEGQTFAGEFLWGKKAMVLYVTPTPGLMVPNAGYTFTWRNLPGAEGLLVPIARKRDDLRNSWVLQGINSFDQKATGTDLGYFFDTAVA